MHGEEEECMQGFSGDAEKKRPLGRRKDNIKMDFREIG
jgi:hypothetical protein